MFRNHESTRSALLSPLAKSLCLIVLLVGCQLETTTVEMVEVMRHDNGLIVKRPKGFTAQKTARGFAMTQEAALRTPLTFEIEVLADGKQPNVGPKWFGLFGFRDRVDESEGGSGGSTYTLTAMHPLQHCWLVLTATKQSEISQPSFLEAWAVLDNTSAGQKLQCEN